MAAAAQEATENIQATRDWVSNLEGRMEDTEVVVMEVVSCLDFVHLHHAQISPT